MEEDAGGGGGGRSGGVSIPDELTGPASSGFTDAGAGGIVYRASLIIT